MPSSSFSTTSDGTPRIVEVTGATVTVDKYAMSAVAGEHEGRPFLVVESRKLVPEPNLASGYSSGHVASDSQPRASASACDCRE